jgi:hypothetical protein
LAYQPLLLNKKKEKNCGVCLSSLAYTVVLSKILVIGSYSILPGYQTYVAGKQFGSKSICEIS